ncbi:MAG: 4Fe-4S dicluster domain-containing protein [Planctomycetes bacterium]|nr:4Fe-4S dicluster domain-containing protein [Planctomycetota bacterium]
MELDRRAFLKSVVIAGALEPAAGARASVGEARPAAADAMGVLVDVTKCNGCRRCEAACRAANGFDALSEESLKDRSVLAQLRQPGAADYTVVNEITAALPAAEGRSVYVKRNCLHCVDPACVSACLVGALRKQPQGAVTYDAAKCMGCRYCMVVCPFQMPAYEYENVLTPQVRKCGFCTGQAQATNDDAPACVRACPKECLTYARRSELLHRAHTRITEQPESYVDHVYGEHEVGGTSWLYLSGVPFDLLGFPTLGTAAPPRLSEAVQHGVFSHFMPPVAWCAILGLTMWLTRSDRGESAPPESPGPVVHDDGFVNRLPERGKSHEFDGECVGASERQ